MAIAHQEQEKENILVSVFIHQVTDEELLSSFTRQGSGHLLPHPGYHHAAMDTKSRAQEVSVFTALWSYVIDQNSASNLSCLFVGQLP